MFRNKIDTLDNWWVYWSYEWVEVFAVKGIFVSHPNLDVSWLSVIKWPGNVGKKVFEIDCFFISFPHTTSIDEL